jgi:hypothetical protein
MVHAEWWTPIANQQFHKGLAGEAHKEYTRIHKEKRKKRGSDKLVLL